MKNIQDVEFIYRGKRVVCCQKTRIAKQNKSLPPSVVPHPPRGSTGDKKHSVSFFFFFFW